MKAWFVHEADEFEGYVFHADTVSNAKKIAREYGAVDCEWIYIRANRVSDLDDRPTSPANLIDARLYDKFDDSGDPIPYRQVPGCPCEMCRSDRVEQVAHWGVPEAA